MATDIIDPSSDDESLEVLAPATSADVVPDESHETVRQNRSVTIYFAGQIDVNVIEPPMVFNAEIEQAIRRQVMTALANVKLGSASNISIRTSASKLDDHDEH
jgi:hypothetical protein